MSSFSPRPGRIAASAFEARIEESFAGINDLYELDGETVLRNRDGRIETGTPETFEQEVWS